MKGDRVSEVKQLVINLEFNKTCEEIKQMKCGQYERMVQKNIEKFTLNYLLKKVKYKGNRINHEEKLNMQSYLFPNQVLSLEDQRSEMNHLNFNYNCDKNY